MPFYYYINLLKFGTFKPDFPLNYDTLLIEYFDRRWIFQRNKIIDRFIRKSKNVYSGINKLRNKYVLKFIFDGEVIYEIAYSDVAYPENAIKIMNGEIINKLKK